LDDQIYLDAPYLSIRWRSVPQILFAEWKGFATSEEFRAALLKGVQAIREHHVVGYVSDARKAKVFVADDLSGLRSLAASSHECRLETNGDGDGGPRAWQGDHRGRCQRDRQPWLVVRKFNSVAAATVWAQSGLGG
jgi:hypothetical protein